MRRVIALFGGVIPLLAVCILGVEYSFRLSPQGVALSTIAVALIVAAICKFKSRGYCPSMRKARDHYYWYVWRVWANQATTIAVATSLSGFCYFDLKLGGDIAVLVIGLTVLANGVLYGKEYRYGLSAARNYEDRIAKFERYFQ